MKKIIAWTLVLAVCLCACGAEPDKTQLPEIHPEPVRLAETTVLNLEPLAGNVAQVSSSYKHIVVLRTDGTVAAMGENEKGQCAVSDWSGIVEVFASDSGTVGLKADGTVVSTWFDAGGWTNVEQILLGENGLAMGVTGNGNVLVAGTEDPDQLAAAQWTDIRSLLTYFDSIYGLKTDGTVVCTGVFHDTYSGTCSHCEISTWTNIEKIFCYDYYLAGVRSDGTVVSSCPEILDVTGWTDLESAVTTYPVYFGISEDGRLLTEGMLGIWTDGTFFYSQDHLYPEISVEKAALWEFTELSQLVAWSPGGYLFGLKTDGSLAQFPGGTLDANVWKDITQLVDGYGILAALRRDGTALSWSDREEYPDISGWENIVRLYAVSVGYEIQFLGLRSDGTFIGSGDLANWDLSRLIN